MTNNQSIDQDKNAAFPAGSAWTTEEANAWFDGHEWLDGLKMEPHESINKQKFAVQYHTNKIWWDKAFSFLKEKDLTGLKPGKYVIDADNVYAIVTEAPTKDFENTEWESHRIYQDIHYLINGHEKIGMVPITSATLTTEYDAKNDVMFYTASGTYHLAKPGTFFIMLPEDVHRPGIKADGYDVVKKIVIKIKT